MLIVLGNIVEDQPPIESEGATLDADVTFKGLVEGIRASEMVVVEFGKEVLFEYADLTISAEYHEMAWGTYYYQDVRR